MDARRILGPLRLRGRRYIASFLTTPFQSTTASMRSTRALRLVASRFFLLYRGDNRNSTTLPRTVPFWVSAAALANQRMERTSRLPRRIVGQHVRPKHSRASLNLIVDPDCYILLRFQRAVVRGNYETGNQAFSMRLRFLIIRDPFVSLPPGALRK